MLEIILSKIQNNPISYEGYLEYAKYLENVNLKQAYLTYENALFYCQDELVRIEIQNKLDEIAYRQGKVEPASIVILSYNNRQLTQQCIESIRETTPISAREIVIVDNNSQDDSVAYLRQQDDIVLVENDFNAGFPGGCNIGIKASKKENDIFLLNNDTILCANSLYTLRMGLYEKESYGAAGSMSERACNHQGFARNVNIDEDFGLRVLMANYQNVLVHNSFLIHYGGLSFNKTNRSAIQKTNILKFNEKFGFENNYSGYTLFSEQYTRCYERFIDKLSPSSKILDVNCEMGARMAHLAYLHSNIDFYGLGQSIQCAMISTHLEGVHIEHYFDIENNPFRSMKFDIISLDCSTIKKGELEKYLSILKDMLSDTGKLMVLAKNQSYCMNWYPIMMGDTKSSLSSDIVYCKDIDEMMISHDLKVESWIFYFGNVSENMKSKVEAIQNIVGKDSKFLIESTAYILHK